MNGVLWTTTAGAIDFAALCIVAAIAVAFGSRRAKGFAASMVAVYLCDRGLLMNFDLPAMMALGGIVDFIAAIAVIVMFPSFWGRSMAALYSLKIAAYFAVVWGTLDFAQMAAFVASLTYFQLMLILAAVPHDGYWSRIRRNNPAGPVYRSGARSVAQRVSSR